MKKTKRLAALALGLCMLFSVAYAEGQPGGSIWDAIGGWFSQAWQDVTSWVGNAWGDASKWVEQAWNDSSKWATEIWGDVSKWAAETYESASDAVSKWWLQTFDTVTATKDNAWDWINKERLEVHKALLSGQSEALASIKDGLSDAGESLKAVYEELLQKLNLSGDDISKVMDTIKAYAVEKAISEESLQKIMLPYLIQLVADSETAGDTSVPAMAVAQYLTGIVEKLGITNEDQALQLINNLDETVNAGQ